jgi:nicotinamidase-related amidase
MSMADVLLLIDVQKAFDDPRMGANRNNRDAEQNIARVLEAWRREQRPVIHVRHMSREPQSPLRPGLPGNDFKEEARPLPGEAVLEKSVNSAFIGTDLEQRLRALGCERLVVAGLTTDHCVSSTVRMSANLGFRTVLLEDCTATYDRETFEGRKLAANDVHAAALASLHGEFAEVTTSDELLPVSATAAAKADRPR